MNVSIVVITYNEENNISECLDTLMAQNYKGKYEIIIVDGKSKDKTIDIVKKYAKKYGADKIRLLVREGYSQTRSRNEGIMDSKYEYVAFTDADCVLPKNWLSILTKKFSEYEKKDSQLAGVGGANIPPENNENVFLGAMGIAFDSWIGSMGSIQAKPLDKDRKVFSLSCTNCIYDKKSLIDAGMFPDYKRRHLGDDWIVGLRMKNKKYTLIGLKDSYVWHKMRSTPKKFFSNMFLYGHVRMHAIKKYFKENSIIYFLPLIFIIGFLTSMILSVILRDYIFLLPLLYFPLILLYSAFLCIQKGKIGLTFQVFVVFLSLHFGYSLGELYGIKWFFMKNQG
jgi:cellulose synthase/poly-beta-1,6-N-acetylglucosamine synthase-like glycosyltransferase